MVWNVSLRKDEYDGKGRTKDVGDLRWVAACIPVAGS